MSQFMTRLLRALRGNSRELRRDDIDLLISRCEQAFLNQSVTQLSSLLSERFRADIRIMRNGAPFQYRPMNKGQYAKVMQAGFEIARYTRYKMRITAANFVADNACIVTAA